MSKDFAWLRNTRNKVRLASRITLVGSQRSGSTSAIMRSLLLVLFCLLKVDGALDNTTSTMFYSELKKRRRDDYSFHLEYRTRWSDNDM